MKYDEEELNRAIEKGTKAWADVPDIGEWVAEQRGRTERQCYNCVYEIYQGSMPSCAHDMPHGEACRFFKLEGE